MLSHRSRVLLRTLGSILRDMLCESTVGGTTASTR